jgi:shikimate kinase
MTTFLIGFMGSGKTTIGKKLAAKLGVGFIDLDAAIEEIEGMYIRDIIETKGESYFRKVESDTLRRLDLVDKVISTGGGTPCFFDNMIWMKSKGRVVYIELDEAALFSRLKTTNLEHRPLLKGLDDEGLKQFIHNKLTERKAYYEQADLRFNPIRESIVDLVSALASYTK